MIIGTNNIKIPDEWYDDFLRDKGINSGYKDYFKCHLPIDEYSNLREYYTKYINLISNYTQFFTNIINFISSTYNKYITNRNLLQFILHNRLNHFYLNTILDKDKLAKEKISKNISKKI